MQTVLSVRETNRIRVALGLKPIPTEDDSKVQSTDRSGVPQLGGSILSAHSSETTTHIKQAQDRIAEAQERRIHREVMSGPSLTDNQPAEPTASWLDRMRGLKKSGTDARREPNTGSSAESSQVPSEKKSLAPKVQMIDRTSVEMEKISPRAPKSSKINRTDHKSQIDKDPLDASSEDETPKPVLHDIDTSKRATFKLKKIRNSHKRRRSDPEVVERPHLKLPPDAHQEYQDILGAQRLAEQRRKLAKPEEIAPQVHQWDDAESVPEDAGPGIVVSETNQFLESMRRRKHQNHVSYDEKPASTPVPTVMDAGVELHTKTQLPDPPAEIPESKPENSLHSQEESGAGNSTESVADVLRRLKQRGTVELRKHESHGQREWSRRLIQQQVQRQMEIETQIASWQNLPPNERNELLQVQAAQLVREDAESAPERFADYKPEVALEYRDSEGNIVDTKEAWKQLSRAFHGNSEGRRRAQRRVRRQHAGYGA